MSVKYRYKVVVGSDWDEFFKELDSAFDDGWENSPPALDDLPLVRRLRRKIRR